MLRDHPLVGRIYDTANKRFISQSALLQKLAIKTDILLGETHDNADHHMLQASVINGLVGLGKRPKIVFEMIPATQRTALAKAMARPTKTATEIAHAIEWEKSGWPRFELYRPIFSAALTANLQILPGEFDGDVKEFIQKFPLPDPQQAALEEELKVSHCGVLPDTVIPKIAIAQRKRDALLALALLGPRNNTQRLSGHAVLIAGSGHTRKDRGVPHYLTDVQAKLVTVNFREVAAGTTDPVDLFEPGEADYIWFTPRHKREDPCVALRKRFGQKKK